MSTGLENKIYKKKQIGTITEAAYSYAPINVSLQGNPLGYGGVWGFDKHFGPRGGTFDKSL